MNEYKIEFRGTNKNWTDDLSKIKSYSKVLRNDCPALYNSATIRIKNGDKRNYTENVHKLSEWIDMIDILSKTCESNGTNDYYFQGTSIIYNFEHKLSTNVVYVYSKGVQVTELNSPEELTEFLHNIQ